MLSLSSTLRVLLRDANWTEVLARDPPLSPQHNNVSAVDVDSTTTPKRLSGALAGRSLYLSKFLDDQGEEDEVGGRKKSPRRSTSASASKKRTPTKKAASAATEAPPTTAPAQEETTASALSSSSSSSSCSAFMKTVFHVKEGIAMLVSDGGGCLWGGRCTLADLTHFVKEHFPSVEVPMTEVLLRLQQSTMADGTMDARGHEGSPARTDDEGAVVETPSAESVFSVKAGSDRPRSFPPSLTLSLTTYLAIVDTFTIKITVPLTCELLHTIVVTPSDRTEERRLHVADFYREMVLEPLLAQRVALSEAVLLLCREAGRTPESVTEQLFFLNEKRLSVNQQEYGWRRQQQQVAGDLLRSLPVAAALQPLCRFSTNMVRFSRDEANEFCSNANTLLEELNEQERKRTPTPPPPLNVPTTIKELVLPVDNNKRPREEAMETGVTEALPLDIAPTRMVIGAAAPVKRSEEAERQKKIRRLFS